MREREKRGKGSVIAPRAGRAASHVTTDAVRGTVRPSRPRPAVDTAVQAEQGAGLAPGFCLFSHALSP